MTDLIVATEFNYPNITVYSLMLDGEQIGWRILPNEGYVMYRTNANDTEVDPETMEEIPVIYYYTGATVPTNYNWANFTWVAVPRDSVDENYIFGGAGNDHEVM